LAIAAAAAVAIPLRSEVLDVWSRGIGGSNLLAGVGVAAVLALGVSCGRSTDPAPPLGTARAAGPQAGDAIVERVVDGDTIVVALGRRDERIRLIGIDTPETVSPTKPVQCYGPQASRHTKALLPHGTRVRLVRDVDERDVYGRLLAYVYRLPDGLFVNLELAADGFAALLTYPPNVAHRSQLVAAVAAAQQRRLGLWGHCGQRDPGLAAGSVSKGEEEPLASAP
jgi:micrococcal nuclease